MTDSGAPAATRVRAGVSVLELATRALELEDVQTRVQRLEEIAEQHGPFQRSGDPRA